MLKSLRTIFENTIDQLGISDYARDAKIVKKYLAADLTREQFAQYCDTFLLSSEFNDERLYRLQSAFQGNQHFRNASVFADMITKLYSANVVLDLGNKDFREKLKNAIDTCVAHQYEMPDIPNAYKKDADIEAHISRINNQHPYLDPSVSMQV
jgi:hypothetical protein